MNKDGILDYTKKRDGKLIGYFQVPFPVFIVHVSYESVDSDPLFPLDRAILQYVKICPKMDKTTYFSNLVGFEIQLVNQRIKKLKDEAFIVNQEGSYLITDPAERKYLTPNSRPTVRVSGSFVVDGKTLDLLPHFIYENYRSLSNWDNYVTAHLAVDLSMNTAPAEKVKTHLKKTGNLEMLHLESTGTNFEVIAFDKKFLNGAYAVIYLDSNNQVRKEIVYEGYPLHCRATGSADMYTIEFRRADRKSMNWTFVPNLGYNVADREQMVNKTVIISDEGLTFMLDIRYKTNGHVFYISNDSVTNLPCVSLNERLLQASGTPFDVVEDAARGFIEIPVESRGIVRLPVANEIQKFVEFVSICKDYNNSIDSASIVHKLSACLSDWRRWMVKFKMYDELEKIDCDCFILNK